MKFYIVPRKLIKLIPAELYKDKIVVITWIANSDIKAHYDLSYDYRTYKTAANKSFILYNLTDEDFTHLNLMGVPIKREHTEEYACLEDAINSGFESFQEEITI